MRAKTGYKPGIAECFEGLAELAAAQGQMERAATLCGAAESLRAASDTPLPPGERTVYERTVMAAHEILGDDALAAAMAAGRSMPLERAVATASHGFLPTAS